MPDRTPTNNTSSIATDAAMGSATVAAVGGGLWGLAAPVVGWLGFTSTGIASGSTAASMMSAAAIANGGGVASGSAVAIMQSIGAIGLATPVGLGLVAGGALIGGAAVLLKSKLSASSDYALTAESDDKHEEEPEDIN